MPNRRHGQLFALARGLTLPGRTGFVDLVTSWLTFEVKTAKLMSEVQRALELVRILTNPQRTDQVHEVSKELQDIQSTESGWRVAEALLSDEDINLRFYGALTFQIKLNKEAHALEPKLAIEILMRLLGWVVQLAIRGERRLVLDKLCSTLTTYFIQSPVKWDKAVRHLVGSLYVGRLLTTEDLDTIPDTSQLIRQLPPQDQLIVVRFCQILAEDMYNLANSKQHAHLSDTFKSNTADVASIIGACFNYAVDDRTVVSVEALNCFSAWVTYAHNTWSSDPVTLQLLQILTPLAAQYLLSNTDELRDPAVELFVTILESRVKFLDRDQLEMISQLVRKKIGPVCLAACQNGNQEPEIVALGKLVAAYGRVTIKDIVSHREKESANQIIALFQGLLTGIGYPGDDDELILSATDFWTEYAEHVVEVVMNSEAGNLASWLPPVRNDLMKALQCYIPKLASPTSEDKKSWDEETVAQWMFFRDTVGDFLESVSGVPDTRIFEQLVTLIIRVLSDKAWLDVEALIFCVNSIADYINVMNEKAAISILMGSSLFSDISNTDANIPVLLKRSVLTMIVNYSPFIKENPIFIPPVLTFLFTIMESTPASQVKTADQAAKSFESLCSSCRRGLTPHLAELLLQCPRALSGPSANAYQKEKIMAALASIIQALPTEEAKSGPLIVLIEVIEADLNNALRAIQASDTEQGELLGTTALQCLASIGKGIQAPDEAYIDLDSDEESTTDPTTAPGSQAYWTAEAGAAVQARILACFEITSYLQNAGDAIEAACNVLRAGLAETQPGPFVFPPSATVAFITRATLSTPRVETMLSTACTFVSASSRRSAPHIFFEILAVHHTIVRMMAELGDPSNDPQLASLCIDFLHRLLASYLDVLLAPEDEVVNAVLNFTIACMTGAARMPKRGACNFFETLLGLARPNNPTPLPQTRLPITQVVSHFAPLLATSLISQISGVAQRSETDALSKALRSFVTSVPGAKQHLETALMDARYSASAVDEKDRRMFLAKVVGLRGSKQTNVVVREFWARCKGTVTHFE